MVDDQDFNWISRFRWYAVVTPNSTYAARNGRHGEGRSVVLMHRQILRAEDGYVVDHTDGNGLNNTRGNLRVATGSQNRANSQKPHRSSSTSKFKGVHRISNGRWKVLVGGTYLGLFDSEEEAASVYNQAAKERWGEFARLNVVSGEIDHAA